METQDYSQHKAAMRFGGLVLMIVGVIISAIGFTNFGHQTMDESMCNGMMWIGGFALAAFGFMLFGASFTKPVSKYYATEMSPAMEITGQSIGKGVGEGLKESGVIGSKESKEVIKIKCPNCGYLESEDAEFCSKCGKRI